MQWCPKCERYVDVNHKVQKLGRSKRLVKVITTCARCRTTLSTKRMTAQAAETLRESNTQTAETQKVESSAVEEEKPESETRDLEVEKSQDSEGEG